MRTSMVAVLAALLGALGFWGLDRVRGPRDNEEPASPPVLVSEVAGVSGASERSAAPAPTVPSQPAPTLRSPLRPVFNPGGPEAAGPAPKPAVPPGSGFPEGAGVRGAVLKEGAAPGVQPATALDEERRLALAAFDEGDRRRGRQLLAGIWALARGRSDLDLGEEARRLLASEEALARRREYAAYLSGRSQGRVAFEDEMERATRDLARVEAEPEKARSAWESLSIAYELGADAADRARVLRSLEPFLETMIFSGRYTPLLETHTVAAGESLSSISGKFGVTVDLLKRLNGLEVDTIQPRMRLRVLSGAPAIFVDKTDFRLWLTVGDRVLLERPVGLGRENRTPTGEFAIDVRQKDPSWWKPGEPRIPPGDSRNILGSRWLGFKDTPELTGFGIHGTAEASSIGTESSAGCIRLRNEDIELLYDFAPPGTRVSVRH